jgi:hypothetical protein
MGFTGGKVAQHWLILKRLIVSEAGGQKKRRAWLAFFSSLVGGILRLGLNQRQCTQFKYSDSGLNCSGRLADVASDLIAGLVIKIGEVVLLAAMLLDVAHYFVWAGTMGLPIALFISSIGAAETVIALS